MTYLSMINISEKNRRIEVNTVWTKSSIIALESARSVSITVSLAGEHRLDFLQILKTPSIFLNKVWCPTD